MPTLIHLKPSRPNSCLIYLVKAFTTRTGGIPDNRLAFFGKIGGNIWKFIFTANNSINIFNEIEKEKFQT